jgi:hypothetical protein
VGSTALKVFEMSDDHPGIVEGSAAEIALLWTVYLWKPARENKNETLEQQIVNFSSTAFGTMCGHYPILQNEKQEILWLIYFKGLLAADSHPRDQMLSAIDTVRKRRANRSAKLSAQSGARQDEVDPTLHAEALAAIDRALSQASDQRARQDEIDPTSHSEALAAIGRALSQASDQRAFAVAQRGNKGIANVGSHSY